MGKIVLENFNEGNGYYKVNLAYLSKEQVEEIETLVSKWKPSDEDIKSCIGMCLSDANEQRFKDYGTNLKDCLAWLEKQGEQKSKNESTDTCDSLIIKSKEFPASEKRDFGYFSESADKIEPKFHEGEWITNGDSTWSEEDYNRITSIKYLLHELDNHNFDDWFDSLKCKPQYIKPSWSEEDERICQCLIEDQEESLDNVRNDKYGHSEIISDLKEMYGERIDWLKSIKERIGWKPSELQIEALESVTENCAYSEYQDCLRELIKQLKKL